MARYDYECIKCEAVQEIEESITKTKPSKTLLCKKCEKKTKHKKIVSKSSFVLKGEGWFKDGY